MHSRGAHSHVQALICIANGAERNCKLTLFTQLEQNSAGCSKDEERYFERYLKNENGLHFKGSHFTSERNAALLSETWRMLETGEA